MIVIALELEVTSDPAFEPTFELFGLNATVLPLSRLISPVVAKMLALLVQNDLVVVPEVAEIFTEPPPVAAMLIGALEAPIIPILMIAEVVALLVELDVMLIALLLDLVETMFVVAVGVPL